MAQNVIVYPSGSTINPYPHIQFSGENGYYFIEMNEDALLYSYQPNIPTSGLTFYLDAAAYDSYSGGTLWWDLTEGRYLIGDGDGVMYDGVMTGATKYRDVNQLIHTEAPAINNNGVYEWWFSDIANRLRDINNNNDYYDELVAQNYDTIFVKLYKSTQPDTYYQIYSGSNASIVAGQDLRLDMVRIDGVNSWNGSDIYNTNRSGYPGLNNKDLDGVVTVEFIPSRNGSAVIGGTRVSADLVNTPYFNPVNGGVFRFDGTNEYARALDPNVRGGTISRTMIGFFSASTSESGCMFGMGNRPNAATTNHSWELWNYNAPAGSGLRIHWTGGNFGTNPEFRLSSNLNKWLMAVLSYNTDTNVATLKIYDNGTVYTGTATNSSIDTDTDNISINISAYGTEGGGMTGNFALLLYYERELASTELDKIYSVFGPRFNL